MFNATAYGKDSSEAGRIYLSSDEIQRCVIKFNLIPIVFIRYCNDMKQA